MSPAYVELLARLDRWMEAGRRAHPGAVPCRAGCTACCHGPFDVTVADAELIRAAVERMPEDERSEVTARAAALLERMRAVAPDWAPPYDIAALGDERFDRLTDALAGEPCPLLGDDGRCRIYEDRPLVCRLIGLPMQARAGRVIENACPIQERFPAYAALAPVPFDLEDFEDVELECLRGAAERTLGDASGWGFETTIAAVVAADAYRATRSTTR
jgi:Fe-S-cluster containining protein